MQRVLHLRSTRWNHLQVVQIQTLQLLQQVHLLIQVVYHRVLLLYLNLHHGNPVRTLLQLILQGYNFLLNLLIYPDQRLRLAFVLQNLQLQTLYQFDQTGLFLLLCIQRILKVLFVSDQTGTSLLQVTQPINHLVIYFFFLSQVVRHLLEHDFFGSESLFLDDVFCISLKVLKFISDLLNLIGDFEFLLSFHFSFSFFIIEEKFDFINYVIRRWDLFLVEHDFFS